VIDGEKKMEDSVEELICRPISRLFKFDQVAWYVNDDLISP